MCRSLGELSLCRCVLWSEGGRCHRTSIVSRAPLSFLSLSPSLSHSHFFPIAIIYLFAKVPAGMVRWIRVRFLPQWSMLSCACFVFIFSIESYFLQLCLAFGSFSYNPFSFSLTLPNLTAMFIYILIYLLHGAWNSCCSCVHLLVPPLQIKSPSDPALDAISKTLKISTLALEECRQQSQRPNIDMCESFVHILLRALSLKNPKELVWTVRTALM